MTATTQKPPIIENKQYAYFSQRFTIIEQVNAGNFIEFNYWFNKQYPLTTTIVIWKIKWLNDGQQDPQ